MGKHSNHFSVTIKPTIPIANQLAAFATNDILFDWTEFRIPRGAARLLNIVALVRGENGADQDLRDLEFFFAKRINGIAPPTLGTPNGPVNSALWQNHLIGMQYMDMDTNNIGSSVDLVYMSMAQMGNRGGGPDLVLSEEGPSGRANIDHDVFYVACITQGAYDFSTAVETTALYDISALTAATLPGLDDGGGGAALANTKFAPGDILYDEDGVLIGEVATIETNAIHFRHDGIKQYHAGGRLLYDTPVDLRDFKIQTGSGDIAANKEIYNLNPVTIRLSLEQ